MADGYKTMVDMLKSSLSERKESYGTTDIQKIIIDGNEFGGYKTFSSYWEKTYVKQPERSSDGTIGNLNSYASFITFHLKVNFAMMSIDDYRRLYDLMLSRNEFTVTAYNVLTNKPHTCRMYFAPDQMPTLYAVARRLQGEKYLEVLGIQDYTIELIGTNAEMEKINLFFCDNNGNVIEGATSSAYKGVEIMVYYNYQAPSGYRFDGEWEKEDGSIVRNGDVIILLEETKLKPKIIDTTSYALSLDYGIGIKPTTMSEFDQIDIFLASSGKTIKEIVDEKNILLSDNSKFIFPEKGTGINNVIYNNKEYKGEAAYSFAGWRLSPNISGKLVKGSDVFNFKKNITIYQIYTLKPYTLTYSTDIPNWGVKKVELHYGDKVSLIKETLDGYKILKWYWYDNGEEVEFNGIMPPFDLTIYAKWE